MGSFSNNSASAESDYASVMSSNTTATSISRLFFKENREIDDENLATKESKDLVKFRAFLVTILFWTTIGVGLGIWIYFTEDTEKEFDEVYMDQADDLFEEVESKFLVAFGAIDSFVLALSAQFSDWPFVTVHKFPRQAEQLLELSCAFMVTNYYFVKEDQRQDWETYSAANDFWVEEGIQKDLAFQKNTLHQKDSSIELTRGNATDLETNSSFMVSTSYYFVNVCEHWLPLRLFRISLYWTGKSNYLLTASSNKYFYHLCIASMATISGQRGIALWLGWLSVQSTC